MANCGCCFSAKAQIVGLFVFVSLIIESHFYQINFLWMLWKLVCFTLTLMRAHYRVSNVFPFFQTVAPWLPLVSIESYSPASIGV